MLLFIVGAVRIRIASVLGSMVVGAPGQIHIQSLGLLFNAGLPFLQEVFEKADLLQFLRERDCFQAGIVGLQHVLEVAQVSAPLPRLLAVRPLDQVLVGTPLV